MMPRLARLVYFAATSLLLSGCLGTDRIAYTPASLSTTVDVPPDAQATQILVVTRVVAMDPRLADQLKLAADFGRDAGSLLDRTEVEKLLRAIQNSPKSKLLASPQAILANGRPTNVAVGQDQPYVSGYRFVALRQTYEPLVSNAWSGIEIDLLAIASPPSPLLTLSLELRFSQLTALTSVPVADAPADLKLDTQSPVLIAQSFRTSAVIPPGATLALMQPTDIRNEHFDLLLLATPRIAP